MENKSQILSNSRPLDVHVWSNYPHVRRVTDVIFDEMQNVSSKPADQRRLKKVLRVILIDLFVRYTENPEHYLAYSRNKEDYKGESRYRRIYIKYDPLIKATNHLIEHGYVEHHMGFHYADIKTGKQSRMRATQKLVDLFERKNLRSYMPCKNKKYEVIQLKGKNANGKKALVEYKETKETCLMRKNVNRINYYLEHFNINIHLSNEEETALENSLSFSNKTLHRVFNNNTFEYGGRFYGGWWQAVPNRSKKLRQYITINGMNTVEVDFSNMHIIMLYAKKGLTIDGDAYELDGYAKECRPLIKQTFNAMLNAKSKQLRESNFQIELLPENKSFENLMDDILNKHQVIKEYFYTGVGLKLQREDSDIAERIMLRVIDEFNYKTSKQVIVLPVHDSFIISTENAYLLAELTDIMKEEFKNAVGVDVKLKQENEYNPESAYQQFQSNYYNKMGITLPATDEQAKGCRRQYEEEYSNYLKREQEWEEFVESGKSQIKSNLESLEVKLSHQIQNSDSFKRFSKSN